MGQQETIRRLAPITRITAMAYETELMTLQRITAREQALRAALAELDAQAAQRFLRSVASADGALSLIDAQDRAWQDWVSVRRGEMQSDLAGVLAEKGEHMAVLTRSLGRKDTAEKMLKTCRKTAQAERMRKQMAALQELSLMQRGRR